MEKLTFYKAAIIVLIVLNIGTLTFLYVNRPDKRFQISDYRFQIPKEQQGRSEDTSPNKERMQGQQSGQEVSEFIVRELGFNREQADKYIKLRDEHHERELNLHDSLHIVKNDFFNLLASDNLEKAKEYAKIIGNLEKERNLNTFIHFNKVRKLCDAEQQEKFDRIIKDVMRMMAGPPKQ